MVTRFAKYCCNRDRSVGTDLKTVEVTQSIIESDPAVNLAVKTSRKPRVPIFDRILFGNKSKIRVPAAPCNGAILQS